MGVSVRTASVRYTEWRDTATGQTSARELYATESDPGETRNRVSDPELAADLEKAEALLRMQFPHIPFQP
jgi:iduronate 2-sulfatase